ncbi:MAG TPA: hypothetical protein PKW56_10035 [Clostridiales bacterium]|nr:hypothetical protein [Clostridiales bacterium]
MTSANRKENFIGRVSELFNLHPVLSGFVLSLISAVFLASLIINRGIIVSNMRVVAFISFVVPGAIIFIFTGLYIGILLNRKKSKEAMKEEFEIGLKLGSIAFYHTWMKDKNLGKDFPAVKGPCCPVCGEDFWEADRIEKGDRLVFECGKCRNTNSVRLRDFESVKEEVDRTLQRAYERMTKFKDKISG